MEWLSQNWWILLLVGGFVYLMMRGGHGMGCGMGHGPEGHSHGPGQGTEEGGQKPAGEKAAGKRRGCC